MSKPKPYQLAIPTDRIYFSDDDWWDIYLYPTRRMRKAFRRAAVSSIRLNGAADIDFSDPDEVRKFAMANISDVDLDSTDDAILLHGTAGWSFGSEISTENIDSMPDHYTQVVLDRLSDLYRERTEEEEKKSSETS